MDHTDNIQDAPMAAFSATFLLQPAVAGDLAVPLKKGCFSCHHKNVRVKRALFKIQHVFFVFFALGEWFHVE